MHRFICPAIIAGFMVVSANAQEATRPFLLQSAAEAGANACLELAKLEGWRVAIAVTDRGGELVYFTRMDDVWTFQQNFARVKAGSAATTPISTIKLAGVTFADDSPLRGIEELEGLTMVEGGVTVKTENGYHIGGVGVSGATPAQDGQCAQAAANAIAKALL